MVISTEGRQYRETISELIMINRIKRERYVNNEKLKVEILANPPDKRRRDLDNICKAILDSLSYARIYDDDSQICDLRIIRGHTKEHGSVTIELDVIGSATNA